MKLHLKNRDGWKKTITGDCPSEFLVLPDTSERIGQVLEDGRPSMSSIRRRDFCVVRTVQITDHRTGATTTEKWLEEV